MTIRVCWTMSPWQRKADDLDYRGSASPSTEESTAPPWWGFHIMGALYGKQMPDCALVKPKKAYASLT
jgi:hypothetical protein